MLLGPRFFGAIWWIWQPLAWQAAFNGWWGNNLWWIWPMLGIIFLPWMTIMYVLVAPGGVNGLDWLWLGLGLFADLAWYGGGLGRKQIPSYQGY